MFDKIKQIFFKYNHWLLYIAIVFIIFPIIFNDGYIFLVDYVFGNKSGFSTENFYIINFLTEILSKIFTFDFISRFFIFLSLFLSIIGSKAIVQNFISNKWIVFVVSLFGIVNPYVYDRIMYGQIGIVMSYGLMMIGTGILLNLLLNSNKPEQNYSPLKQIIFATIFFGLSISTAFHFAFFSSLILISFLVLFIINKTFDFKSLIKFSAITIFVISLININVFIGFINHSNNSINSISQVSTTKDLVAFQTSGKYGFQAFYNTLSMSGFWGKDQFRYTDLTSNKLIWNSSFLIVLSLSIYGFIKSFKYFKEKNINYASYVFISLFLASLILAIGIKAPVAKEISEFLFNYLPFYKGMREPQKWVSVLNIVYIIFISIGVKNIIEYKLLSSKYNKVAFLIILSFVFILRAPTMLFAFNGQVKTINYPKDWYQINDIIKSKSNCKSNTLFLPWHMYMNFRFINTDITKGVVANPAQVFFSCPTIFGNNMEFGGIYENSTDNRGKDILNNFLKKNGIDSVDVLYKYNIKYIILAKEVDYNNYLLLQSLDYLKLVKETNNLFLFEVK